MKLLGRKSLIISVIAAIAMTLACAAVFAADGDIKVTDYSYPQVVRTGGGFDVKGTVKAPSTISKIELGVMDKSGDWTECKYVNEAVGAKKFKLSEADSTLKFGVLAEGSYYYRLYVTPEGGERTRLFSKKFIVTSETKPFGVDCSYPTKLEYGSGFGVSGTIKSVDVLRSVTVGVKNASTGDWTALKYVNNSVNSKVFNVGKADSSLRFGLLASGKYKYIIIAKTDSGKTTVLNKNFTVGSESDADAVTYTSGSSVSSSAKGVTLKGCKSPGNYKVGKAFKLTGTITSKKTIKKVEIGIVYENTNKWTTYKYTKSNVNAKTFDISKADSRLLFSRLPAGTFRYRIYVHTADGVAVALNKKFKVTGSNKPAKAVKWAKKIANDDSFTYGKKPAANAIGCYFCGTNKRYKPKGYEKTYVCMTFIGAAYAHGAKDPEIYSACSRGKMTMYETNSNFTCFSCWMKLGACRDLSIDDLMPGDVVIQWSDHNDNTGHTWMYIGGNKLVESSGGGWGANSIAIKTGAAERLRIYGQRSKKNYVMRYNK